MWRGREEGFDGHSSVLGIILWEVRKVSYSLNVLAVTLTTDRDAVLQKLLKNPDLTHKDKADLQERFHHGPIKRDQIVIFQRFRNPV